MPRNNLFGSGGEKIKKKKLNKLFLDSAGEAGPRSRTYGWVCAPDGVVAPTHTCTHRTLQGQAGAGPAWILVQQECPALFPSHPQPHRVSMLRGGHRASLLEEPWRKKPLVKGKTTWEVRAVMPGSGARTP